MKKCWILINMERVCKDRNSNLSNFFSNFYKYNRVYCVFNLL